MAPAHQQTAGRWGTSCKNKLNQRRLHGHGPLTIFMHNKHIHNHSAW
jgi:hypothetical protein